MPEGPFPCHYKYEHMAVTTDCVIRTYIAFYALVKPSELVGGDDAEEAAWFTIPDLQRLYEAILGV